MINLDRGAAGAGAGDGATRLAAAEAAAVVASEMARQVAATAWVAAAVLREMEREPGLARGSRNLVVRHRQSMSPNRRLGRCGRSLGAANGLP